MAIAREKWEYVARPLPRQVDVWDPQFATSYENYEALSKLTHRRSPQDPNMIHDSEDLTKLGNTTILRTRAGDAGHWRLNGGAITLAELFHQFGKNYTVAELMLWYCQAPKMLKKRPHAWGSKDVRAAATERWKVYGRAGHQD